MFETRTIMLWIVPFAVLLIGIVVSSYEYFVHGSVAALAAYYSAFMGIILLSGSISELRKIDSKRKKGRK